MCRALQLSHVPQNRFPPPLPRTVVCLAYHKRGSTIPQRSVVYFATFSHITFSHTAEAPPPSSYFTSCGVSCNFLAYKTILHTTKGASPPFMSCGISCIPKKGFPLFYELWHILNTTKGASPSLMSYGISCIPQKGLPPSFMSCGISCIPQKGLTPSFMSCGISCMPQRGFPLPFELWHILHTTKGASPSLMSCGVSCIPQKGLPPPL